MPYRIIIKDNETDADISGIVYLYNSEGTEIGSITIPKGGADISDSAVFEYATHIEVNSAGYASYGLDTALLYESTVVYLVKREVEWTAYALGGLIVLVGMNLLAKRSTKIL